MEHAARPCSSGVPPLPALGGDCSLDDVAVQFLVAQTLLEREQKALALKEEEEELKAVLASKEHRLMVELSFVRPRDRTSPLSLVEAVAASWAAAKNDLMKREKRKKKKKKKKTRRKKKKTRRRTRCAGLGSCSAALHDVSYASLFNLMGGVYFPLYLAVTCPIWFLLEEYSTWHILGDDFRIRRIQRFLVRQWIHVTASLRLRGYSDLAIVSCLAVRGVLSLVVESTV